MDASQARALPGVLAVITGQEAVELCDPMPDFGPDPARHTWRCLAADKVRYVGEGVAVAVADSRYLAEDALRADRGRVRAAAGRGRPGEAPWRRAPPLVHEALGSNFAYERDLRVRRRRARLRRGRRRRHRPPPLAPLGRPAAGDRRRRSPTTTRRTGSFTIDTNSLSFTSYLFMAANTLKVPANKLDIGRYPAAAASAPSCSRTSQA